MSATTEDLLKKQGATLTPRKTVAVKAKKVPWKCVFSLCIIIVLVIILLALVFRLRAIETYLRQENLVQKTVQDQLQEQKKSDLLEYAETKTKEKTVVEKVEAVANKVRKLDQEKEKLDQENE